MTPRERSSVAGASVDTLLASAQATYNENVMAIFWLNDKCASVETLLASAQAATCGDVRT